jgi:hypothetical protein
MALASWYSKNMTKVRKNFFYICLSTEFYCSWCVNVYVEDSFFFRMSNPAAARSQVFSLFQLHFIT